MPVHTHSSHRPPRVLITCGPAYAPIDSVRRITNLSTGELGTLLATTMQRAGMEVLCLRGEGATFAAPESVRCETFGTNESLEAVLCREAGQHDVVFHAAALCDFEVETGTAGSLQKIPSTTQYLALVLRPARKLLPSLRKLFPEGRIVGWKYELDGNREQALARGKAQIHQCATEACVVNGAAYGAGLGFLERDGTLTPFDDKSGLCQFLADWVLRHPAVG